MNKKNEGKIPMVKNGFLLMVCEGKVKTYGELLYLMIKVYKDKGISLSEYRSIFRFFNFTAMDFNIVEKEISQEEIFDYIKELNNDLNIPKTEILKLIYTRYEQGRISEEELKEEITRLDLVELNNSLPDYPNIVM